MAVPGIKPQNFTVQTASASDDRIPFVKDPTGTPLDSYIEPGDLLKGVLANDFANGSILEDRTLAITSDGATITATVSATVGTDLTFRFSDGQTVVDFTTPKTVALTAGTDTVPVENYLYFLQTDPTTLVKSTVGFPSAEYSPIGRVIVQTAGTVQSDGVLKQHDYTDHLEDSNDQGHITHINDYIREQFATWLSGVAPTITGSPSATVTYAVTSGVVKQLHTQTFPAIVNPAPIIVINDSASPYKQITNIGGGILTDSLGGSLTGKHYPLVFWGEIAETGSGESKIYCNVPSGSYNTQSQAESDSDNFANFSIPIEFKGVGFLIQKIVMRNQTDTTFTAESTEDLRGLLPNTSAGTSTAQGTEFSDAQLAVFNDADNTKILVWDNVNISTATTRTWTPADRDFNFSTPVFDSVTVDNLFFNGSTILTTSAMTIQTTGTNQSMTIGPTGTNSSLILRASQRSIDLSPSASFDVEITQGSFKVENITTNLNDITSTNTDGNINLTPNGNGRLNFGKSLIHETSSLLSVVAGTGIVSVQDEIVIVESNTAGDTNITANPQITLGIEGERRSIIGTDDTKTVTLDDGDGLVMVGGFSFTLKNNYVINFVMRNSLWVEESRSVQHAGGSEVHTTVGTGGDFATVGAAITAGIRVMSQVSDVVETGNATVTVDEDVFLNENGFNWDKDDFEITCTGTSKFVITGDGTMTVRGAVLDTHFVFASTCTLDMRGVREFTATGSGYTFVNAGIHLVGDTTFNLFNGPNKTFLNSEPGSRFGNMTVNGAGTSTSDFIENANEATTQSIIFKGVFDVDAADPIVDIVSSAGAIVDKLESIDTVPYIKLSGIGHKVSNIINMSIDPTTSSFSNFTDCSVNFFDATDTSFSSNFLQGVRVVQNVVFGGDLNKGCTNRLTGDLTFNAGSDNNKFLLTEVVGSTTDNGSGNSVTN